MNHTALEPPPTTPALAIDPFSDAVLNDPYAFHEELRETAPVVRLESLGVWALGRYAEVSGTLNNWETFCSSAGVGLSDFRKEKPWRSQPADRGRPATAYAHARGDHERALAARLERPAGQFSGGG